MWLAVILIPAIQPSSLTAKESSGVGRKSSKIYALIPFPASVSAASVANSFDIRLESNAIATPLSFPFCDKM